MKHLAAHELIALVLESFEAEQRGDVSRGRALLAPDFMRTRMGVWADEVFPRLQGDAVEPALIAAFSVQGREFHVFNTAANEATQTVFVELAEYEPHDAGATLWPYTLVCTIEDGRIKHTRHYGDPALIQQGLSLEQIRSVVSG